MEKASHILSKISFYKTSSCFQVAQEPSELSTSNRNSIPNVPYVAWPVMNIGTSQKKAEYIFGTHLRNFILRLNETQIPTDLENLM